MVDNRSNAVEGAEAVKAAFDALGALAELELLKVAEQTAARIADGARVRLKARTGPLATGHTASSITFKYDAARQGFIVFVDIPSDRPFNLDLWLEFGTVKMPGRPFLFPAARFEEPGFRRQAEAVLARAVEAAARGAR